MGTSSFKSDSATRSSLKPDALTFDFLLFFEDFPSVFLTFLGAAFAFFVLVIVSIVHSLQDAGQVGAIATQHAVICLLVSW